MARVLGHKRRGWERAWLALWQALEFERGGPRDLARGNRTALAIQKQDVAVTRRKGSQVIGDAAQRHGGHNDAGILVGEALVADRQHQMWHVRAAGHEDRAHNAPITQNRFDGNMPRETGHVLSRKDLMGSEGIVSGCDRLEGGRNQRLSLGVQQGHHAEIVALVVHELEELAQGLGSRQRAPHSGQIQDACLDRHGGLQVGQVAADVLRDLARQQNLVALDGLAQGGLADPNRRVAGYGQRRGSHADGEEREFGQQLQGAVQEKGSGRRVQPLKGSNAQTQARVSPLEPGTTPVM